MPETVQETESKPASAPLSEAPLIEHPTHSLDDLGNILRARDSMRPRWAFVSRENLLLRWTGKYWAEDHGQKKMLKAALKAVEHSLLDECDEIEKLAEQHENEAYAKKVEILDAWISESRQSKHITPLKMLPIWLERSNFSPSPDYLAFADGTLRLKDCKFTKKHRPKDNLRAVIPHALDLPNSHKCLRWQSMLDFALPNQKTQDLLQQLLGYSLLHGNPDHLIVCLFGTGANSKSTIVDTWATLLGDYSCRLSERVLIKSKYEEHSTIFADLEDSLFAFLDETADSVYLDSKSIKSITGAASLKARRMHKNNKTFPITWLPLISTNYKPRISDTSEGMWRRLVPIEFKNVVPLEERIGGFYKTLVQEEGTGILQWAVEGLRKFQQAGHIELPEHILADRDDYHREQDTVALFLSECTTTKNKDIWTPRPLIHRAYVTWCADSGHSHLGKKNFFDRLRSLGYAEARDRTGNVDVFCFVGIKIEEQI
jgi:putative DNA primase/helicase